MTQKSILFCFVNVFCFAALKSDPLHRVTCGVDLSPVAAVYEGIAKIETYPWLGILFYPFGQTRVTTVVVLVTKQLLLGSASEIDKVPKSHFRARSRVVLGQNCSGPSLKVRDYTYHPEFEAKTYSALALIQLDVDEVNIDCDSPVVKIHEMEFVDYRKCEQFYRRSGLDTGSFWPTHVTCARALYGGECVWRGGAALATKIGNRWHLVGFGVYGPGCRAPARFMDYGMYTKWVKTSVARIGKPAVTRLASDHIVLRSSLGNLQRYGPCDQEEMKENLYTDVVEYSETEIGPRTIKYNITIYHSVEYSCVTFQIVDQDIKPKALLTLRRWCAQPRAVCYGFHLLQIEFYVEIKFVGRIVFMLKAYGRQAKVIDAKAAMRYANLMRPAPNIPDDDEYTLNAYLNGKDLFWA